MAHKLLPLGSMTRLRRCLAVCVGTALVVATAGPANAANPRVVLGLDCVAASRCVVIGVTPDGRGTVVYTTTGGDLWRTAVVPDGVAFDGDIDSRQVSCPSTSTCLAAARIGTQKGAIIRSVDAGATWRKTSLPSGFTSATQSHVFGVSCPSLSTCHALVRTTSKVKMLISTDGGRTWRVQLLPVALNTMTAALACGSATNCQVVGTATSTRRPVDLRTTNGGRTWLTGSLPTVLRSTSAAVTMVDCPTSTVCEALGHAGSKAVTIRTANAGRTWSRQTLPRTGMQPLAISCASATACQSLFILGSGAPLILRTTNGGTSWRSDNLPAGSIQINDLVCPSATVCEATGGEFQNGTNHAVAFRTTDGGRFWDLRSY